MIYIDLSIKCFIVIILKIKPIQNKYKVLIYLSINLGQFGAILFDLWLNFISAYLWIYRDKVSFIIFDCSFGKLRAAELVH